MSDSNIEGKQSAFNPADITALSHLYRGELYRSTVWRTRLDYRSAVWRTRLDTTTNWAVLTTGIALSLTFSSESASPLPLVLAGSHRLSSNADLTAISLLRLLRNGLYTGRVENNPEQKKKQIVPTASAILDDGTLVEMVFQPKQRRTLFAIYSAGRWTLQDAIDIGSDAIGWSTDP